MPQGRPPQLLEDSGKCTSKREPEANLKVEGNTSKPAKGGGVGFQAAAMITAMQLP